MVINLGGVALVCLLCLSVGVVGGFWRGYRVGYKDGRDLNWRRSRRR